MLDINAFTVAGAPIIFAVIQIVRQAVSIPSRWVPALNLVLAAGYVALAAASGEIDGTIFQYALATIGLSAAAAGIHTTTATFTASTVLTTGKK